MRGVALGSVITLSLFTGLLVSQVEAKNHDNEGKDKNKHAVPTHVVPSLVKHNDTRSVPIPGTLLALGGGLVGLVAWRARQRKSRA
jgi:hypothetical protein